MSLYSEFIRLIQNRGLLDGVSTLVVGLSGGPDSICLTDLLLLARERGDISLELHAAHLNHGLRGQESDEDEWFVREFAASRGLPLTVERREVGALCVSGGGSLEEVARRERYQFLESAARSADAQAVAVAHNADDQIETVLHRFIRGAGLRGMRGMPLNRPITRRATVRIIRPLLRARRVEILEHIKQRGLSFRRDSSNLDTSFLRNRIRAELIPLLESHYNAAAGSSILRLSRSIAEAYDFLERSAATVVADAVRGGAIDAAMLANADDALKPLVIDAALAHVADEPPQLDAKHYEAIAELARIGEPGSRIDLPARLAAVRTEREILIAAMPPAPPAPPEFELPLSVPGQTVTPFGTVTARRISGAEFDLPAFLRNKTDNDEAIDASAIECPMAVRSRRNGDSFQPLGARGRKKVGDFLTDRKVPAAVRERLILVTAGDKIVWVVGHRIDDSVKVTARTKEVLLLSVSKT